MRIDVDRIKEQPDLLQLAARFTTLKGNNSLTGPCPKCYGENRFVAYHDRFL